eukprot:g1930.t1
MKRGFTGKNALAESANSATAKNLDHLNAFDISALEEMDPSVSDGFVCCYDREVSMELRMMESDDSSTDVGCLEKIKVKMVVLGAASDPKALRIELSSENDLFFYYMNVLDSTGFTLLAEQQKLMVDFGGFTTIMIKMLNGVIGSPQENLAVLVMKKDGTAKLDFVQNMNYKFVELLSLNFERVPDELVQEQITYRYNCMKAKLALAHARLNDINALLKIKNPSLLLQIQKFGTTSTSKLTSSPVKSRKA